MNLVVDLGQSGSRIKVGDQITSFNIAKTSALTVLETLELIFNEVPKPSLKPFLPLLLRYFFTEPAPPKWAAAIKPDSVIFIPLITRPLYFLISGALVVAFSFYGASKS